MGTHGYQWRKRPPGEVHKLIGGVMHRCCPDCLLWKPATLANFYACSHAKDGLQVRCKPCHVKRCPPAIKRHRERREIARTPPMILPATTPGARPFEIELSAGVF